MSQETPGNETSGNPEESSVPGSAPRAPMPGSPEESGLQPSAPLMPGSPIVGGSMPGAPMPGAPISGGPMPGALMSGMPGYQAPGLPSQEKASGMAIASMILSVAGLLCGITAIVGIILGIIELGRIKRGEASTKGRSLAKAGIIIGAVVIGLSLLIAIISIFTGGFSFEINTST